jgi:hypothetical protein
MSLPEPKRPTTPVDIPPVKAIKKPHFYISTPSPLVSPPMTTSPRKPVLSALVRSLMNLYDDLPMEEIYLLEDIMKENKETQPDCWLVDQITNWVYEDTTYLMPVEEAYRMVKLGILNE